MKKALTTRQRTVQMLLERWREKQEKKEAGTATLVSIKQPQPRPHRQPAARQLKID
jgi:hypothetical protein